MNHQEITHQEITLAAEFPAEHAAAVAEQTMDDGGDPCPVCGHVLPNIDASPVICEHCGEEVE